MIGGDCVAEGYYKNPEKTREEFVDVEGRRWFRSGDIGELHHDGCIKIIGRAHRSVFISIRYFSLSW